MNRMNRTPGWSARGIVAGLPALALAACANAPQSDGAARLEPAADEALAMRVAARGVQVYQCRPAKNGAGHEWAFVAPEAELFDERGNTVGTHSAGPSWQAVDGSRVVGVVRQRADAPAPGAVPWLLLAAEANGAQGVFSRVTSIQRVNTAGGVAPASGCTQLAVGTQARVDYTADYNFFTPR